MIIVTSTFTRPSVNVPFFVGNKSTVDQHISGQFQLNPPKILSRTRQISEDLLVLTVKVTFINQAAKTEFDADSVVAAYFAAQAAHNSTNGIVESTVTIEQ